MFVEIRAWDLSFTVMVIVRKCWTTWLKDIKLNVERSLEDPTILILMIKQKRI